MLVALTPLRFTESVPTERLGILVKTVGAAGAAGGGGEIVTLRTNGVAGA